MSATALGSGAAIPAPGEQPSRGAGHWEVKHALSAQCYAY